MALTKLRAGAYQTGSVVQVVEGKYEGTAGSAQLLTDGSWTDINLSASITPSSTSSKILITAHLVYYTVSGAGLGARILRGSTAIYDPSPAGATGPYLTFSNGNNVYGTLNFSYIDSPSTTSSTTYKIQGQKYDSSNAYLPYNGDSGGAGAKMSIILMEIAG